MAAPFVVFATQRTGSSWVASMLGSHPAVETYGELFQRGAKRDTAFDPYFLAHGGRRNRRRRLTFRFLDALYAAQPGIDAIGFKLMYQDVKENPAILAYLARRKVRVVHLVRANLLDVVVSNETARARGRYHAEGAVEQVAVAVDAESLVRRLRSLERKVKVARTAVAAAFVPHVEVSYESLLAEPRRFADLLRFLDVCDPDTPLTSQLRKLNSLRKEDTISNFAEVERALSGTRFAAFIDR
ncbi:MAG TPA: hypothetical protein VGC78_12895 [Gaiellaceae bacterium]